MQEIEIPGIDLVDLEGIERAWRKYFLPGGLLPTSLGREAIEAKKRASMSLACSRAKPGYDVSLTGTVAREISYIVHG